MSVAVNKPKGDNARKGAVKKRSQVKTELGGATAWTKRSKKSGEFMAVKSEKDEGRQKIQGGEGREKGWEKEGEGGRSALILTIAAATAQLPELVPCSVFRQRLLQLVLGLV